MPTSETRTAMGIADLGTFLRRIKSNTLKLASSILRQMENWKNGTTLTVRFHESLDTKWYLQTPDIAFWSRLPKGCKLGMFMNRGVYNVQTFGTTH
jgi:hypothetical protein